jgi:PAS domain S-box-containing protein
LERALPTALAWVRLEATVRGVATDTTGRVALRVAAGGLRLDLHVPAAPEARSAATRVGARLRLRGVLEPAADAWSRPRLWLADWAEAAVVSAARGWSELETLSAAALEQAPPAGSHEEIRFVGRALGRRSARSFRLEDDTGVLTADLDRPELVREGTTYEVRGFPALRRGEPVLEDGRWRSVGVPPSRQSRHEPGLRVLTSALAVRGLPRAEAARGYPVRLEAVVTYAGAGRLFLQDATGGLYVHVDAADPGVSVGDRVRLQGFTAPGGLAAMATDAVLQRLGPGVLPPAAPVSATRLVAGYDDCRRVEVAGLVRRLDPLEDGVELVLGVEGQRVTVRLPALAGAARPGVDARVRVRAVCATTFNWRGQFDHVELLAASAGDLRIDEPGADPFTLPLLPTRDLLRSQSGGRWERLVRTRGAVLHQRAGGTLYLRSPTGAVVVETTGVEPFEPGDEVDVAGFSAAGSFGPRLQDALVRRVSRGRPPLPIVLGSAEGFGPFLDAELASFQATLLETVTHDTGTSLVLQAADRVIEARGDGGLPPAPKGSLLEVTGIVLAGDPGDASGPHLRLVLRRPGDVRLVARPPWLTPERGAWIVAGLGAAALLALAWVHTLRRRVRARTAELRATERRYRLLADNASDVILTTDRELRLTYVSPSVTRDSGYTAEEALAMSLESVLTPASWACLRETLAAGAAPGAPPAELELEILRKDGSTRWMHVRTSPLRAPEGFVTGFLAAARDVTSRRRTQQELARLAAAIEQSGDAVVLTDTAGAILYVNPAFERVTGYAPAEVLGGTPALLKSGAHDRAFYDALWSTLRAGGTWQGRFTNRRKDGRLFLEDASIAPVRDGATVVGYVAVKRDVTRQVELEERLAQAGKLEAVGRLAAGIAHDFNNTLAVILNLADVALKSSSLDERTRTCVDGIREAALRAGGLTRQILTFSRQAPVDAAPLDPREAVAQALGMLRVIAPERVQIRERLDSTALVAGDATQLQQVVLNLGTNAGLAAREEGGTIEVALEDVTVDAAFAEANRPLRAGHCVRLVVRDDGYGMRPATVARAFEPFFTTRGAQGGSGMGLAVVHGIVHNHGGAITVESELGRGSTFTVYLPALPREGADVPAAG